MDKLKSIKNHIFNFFKNPFKDFKKALTLLALIIGTMLLAVIIVCLSRDSFFVVNTDDMVQYYPIMSGFIDKIKEGKLSLYDHSFFHGTSIFAQTYYVPFDIFTLLTLIFSFIFQNEQAYFIVNMIKILSGSLLFAYVLHKQGLKPKTIFFGGLIWGFTGLLATEIVYPVYLSLLFYVPLAMFVADEFICNKFKFWYIPVYILIAVFYDFYIAYMLCAFLFIYTLIRAYTLDKFSIIGKNTLIKNKDFYIYSFGLLGLILLGVMMSAVVFLPSYSYINNKTFRNPTNNTSFFVYLAKEWPSHYIDVTSTYFMPGDPIAILHPRGGYMDKHASLFMGIGSLVYLVMFFFTKNKENNRLKVFVILFNILLCFPIVSMIMSGQTVPYIRWFFIVYVLNVLAVIKSIEYFDYQFGKTIPQKILIASIFMAMIWYVYTLFKNEKFTMYTDNQFKDYIYIIFMVVSALYLISMFIPKINKHITQALLGVECLIAAGCVFAYSFNTSDYYLYAQKRTNLFMEELKDVGVDGKSLLDETSVHKAAVQAYETEWFTNAGLRNGNINSGTFFHSFYDATINDYYKYYLYYNDLAWTRTEHYNYYMPFSMVSGYKYYIVPTRYNWIAPDFAKYVNNVVYRHDNGYDYIDHKIYEITDMKPFIIYDEFTNERYSYGDTFRQGYLNLLYGSFGSNFDSSKTDKYSDLTGKQSFELITKHYNLRTISRQDMINNSEISKLENDTYSTYKTGTAQYLGVEKLFISYGDNSDYYKFQIPSSYINSSTKYLTFQATGYSNTQYKDWKFLTNQEYYVTDASDDVSTVKGCFFGSFGIDTNTNDYDNCNDTDFKPSYVYVRAIDSTTPTLNVHAFTNKLMDNYLKEQNQYRNQESYLDGNKMYIKVNYDSANYGRILKTNYTYSSEWKTSDPKFETVNILGGFLGVVLPAGSSSCDIVLTFKPDSLATGAIISTVSITALTTATVCIYLHKKKKDETSSSENELEQ